MKYTIKKSQLDQIIKEEVQRFQELKKLKQDKQLIEGAIKRFEETGELNEIVGTLGKKIGNFLGTTPESKRDKLIKSPKISVWQRKGYKLPEGGMNTLIAMAAKDDFAGDWGIDEKTKTINYRNGDSIKRKSMMAGGGMSGTAMFEGNDKPSMNCEKCDKAITEMEFDANFGKCKGCKSK